MRTTIMTVLAAALMITTTLLGVAMAADKGGTVVTPLGGKGKVCPMGEKCVYVDKKGNPLPKPICKPWCPPECTACTN